MYFALIHNEVNKVNFKSQWPLSNVVAKTAMKLQYMEDDHFKATDKNMSLCRIKIMMHSTSLSSCQAV